MYGKRKLNIYVQQKDPIPGTQDLLILCKSKCSYIKGSLKVLQYVMSCKREHFTPIIPYHVIPEQVGGQSCSHLGGRLPCRSWRGRGSPWWTGPSTSSLSSPLSLTRSPVASFILRLRSLILITHIYLINFFLTIFSPKQLYLVKRWYVHVM